MSAQALPPAPLPQPPDYGAGVTSLADRERRFRRVAQAVTARLAELLPAAVCVTDSRGAAVAGFGAASTTSAGNGAAHADAYLRIPLCLDGHSGEVIVGPPYDGEVIPSRLAEAVVELVINQATVLDQLPNQRELKDKFIHDLLHGLLTDEAVILSQAKLLGLDFTPPRAVILIDAASYILGPASARAGALPNAGAARRAELVIGSVVGFFQLPNDTICAYLGAGEIVVLKASNTRNLVTWAERSDPDDQASRSWANLTALKRAARALLTRLRSDTGSPISVGIGRYHPGVRGLASSYQDARAALSLGRRFHGLNGVHCLDSLGIPAFVGVADERTKVELATYLLSPLADEPELLDTLEAFFAADTSPSATAERLSIHRNTLAYRLAKIASLTGLNPHCFDDAVQIRLALVLRSLAAPAG